MRSGGKKMASAKFLLEMEDIIGKTEKVVETHMSIIYMGKDLVAKVTKPVDLGFVDYTSIEKRRDTAIKTAQIDVAYCKDLQSRVVEIDGIPVVIMRRFDSSNGLNVFYDQGMVTVEHARQIGNLFAEAHKHARTDDQISEIGYRSILANWEELFFVTKNVAMAVGKTVSAENYQQIVDEIQVFISSNAGYFERRKSLGFIKQTHGDGHAGNMFVEDGQVKIFDGIGFKDEFSFADTISDIAFPIMDAIMRDRIDIAEEIKTSYLEKSQDIEGVERLLDFYVCYRAFVRGQVSTMIASGMPEEEREEMLEAAKKYYDLAVGYLPK